MSKRRFTYGNPSKMDVIVHANSIGFGANASSSSKAWPQVVKTMGAFAGKGISVRNASVSGIGISTSPEGNGSLISLAPSSVDPYLVSDKDNFLFTHEFINEMEGNTNNPSAAWSSYKTYISQRRSAASSIGGNLIPVLITCTPSAPPTATQTAINNKNNALRECNRIARAQYRDCFDWIIDLAEHEPFKSLFAQSVITSSDLSATGLYSGQTFDGLHFGDAGYNLIGKIVGECARKIIVNY